MPALLIRPASADPSVESRINMHFRDRTKRWQRPALARPILLGLVLLGVTAVVGAVWITRGPSVDDRPNIVLVIIDTMRADALGVYGCSRPTTPAIDAVAKQGVIFEQAISSSPWTLPAVASILTGVHPSVHGAFGKGMKLWRCRDEIPRGAEYLRDAGFSTKAIVNAPFLHPDLGLDIGFQDYDFYLSTNPHVRRADESVTLALAHLKAHKRDRNFLLLHLFDPHLNYDPPGEWATRFTGGRVAPKPPLTGPQIKKLLPPVGEKVPTESDRQYVRAVYDGEVGFVDTQIARLVDGLREFGLWDRTTLIITSDHGEEFWDHDGFEHGHTMYDELIRVPLIIKLPKKYPLARNVVKSQVRTLDLMPTFFELVGLAPLDEFDGQSLVSLMLGSAEGGHRAALSEGTLYREEKLSWRVGEYKYIHNMAGKGTAGKGDELYRLSDDPGEQRSLIEAEPRLARQLFADLTALRTKLAERAAGMSEPEPVRMRQRFLRALKDVGYMGGHN